MCAGQYIRVLVDVLANALGGRGGGVGSGSSAAAWQIFSVICFSSEIMEHVVVFICISVQLQTLLCFRRFYGMIFIT